MATAEKSAMQEGPVIVLGTIQTGAVRIGWGSTGAREMTDRTIIGTFVNPQAAIDHIRTVVQSRLNVLLNETLGCQVITTDVATFWIYPLSRFMQATKGKLVATQCTEPHLVSLHRLY